MLLIRPGALAKLLEARVRLEAEDLKQPRAGFVDIIINRFRVAEVYCRFASFVILFEVFPVALLATLAVPLHALAVDLDV